MASAQTFPTPSAGHGVEEQSINSDTQQREMWLEKLRAELHTLLGDARHPLRTEEVVKRLGRKVRFRTVRRELSNDPQVRSVGDDRWVLRRSSIPSVHHESSLEQGLMDRIAQVLADAGHPLLTSWLAEKVGSAISPAYLKRKLDADERFTRSDVDMWALAEWGMPAYKAIRELIADLVDIRGGAVSSDEVIRVLTRDFSVKESSLRVAMSSPPFTVRGGIILRLADVDEVVGNEQDVRNGTGTDGDEGPSASDLMGLMGL